MTKDKLYLLPVYIGSLKYYEKLLPYLNEKYDVRFLIVRPDDERRRGMLAYCEAHGLNSEILDAGLSSGRIRVPFISAIIKRIAHQRACRALFDSALKAKLVAVKATAGFKVLFREANRRGIETIVLQSALTPPPNFYRPDALHARPDLFHTVYYRVLSVVFFIADVLANGFKYPFISSHPTRVGVIGPEGVEIFQTRFGFNPSTITVVGNAEFQRVAELREKVLKDNEYKESLLKKYGLKQNKKRILIMSVWFEHHGAVRPAHLYSREETDRQIAHYCRIIEIIRSVCSEKEYEILFKLHPSEKNIYESYASMGVLFFGDDSISEELLVLSDLYIADPCTSANYMVIASGIPAIFDNTEGLPALNKCSIFYPMIRITTNCNEFTEKVKAFKNNELELGYDTSAVNKHSIDQIVEFIGR